MNALNAKVNEFQVVTGAPQPKAPSFPGDEREELRVGLIEEELEELTVAMRQGNLTEALDALCDLQYVLSGTILELGLGENFDAAFAEVHASNMSKFCENTADARESVNKYLDKGVEAYYKKVGNRFVIYRSSDNKTLKGKDYFEPRLAKYLK